MPTLTLTMYSINDNVRIMSRTLDYLLDICKSIRINGLNIKYHKILQRFKKNLLEHITMFNIVSNTNLIEFAIHFKKIMKIFILLSSDYPYEEFNYIKSRCILIFKKNSANLFDKNIFFQIVHLLNNKKGVDALQTNNLDQSFQEKKILLSLYFTFFKLIAKNTFYFYKNNDEDNLIIDILIKNNLSIDYKFSIFFYCFLQNLSMNAMSFFIVKSFGSNNFSIFDSVAAQSFVTLISITTPLPGSAGTTEGTFITLYKKFINQEKLVSIMILFSTINYYLGIITSAIIITISNHKTKKTRQKRENKK